MSRDEKIQRDPEAIKIKKNLEDWLKLNPGRFAGDEFWKEVQLLRGRYTIAILSRFFQIDYHRMQRGYNRGWSLTQGRPQHEFAEMKENRGELSLVPVPQKKNIERATTAEGSLVLEVMMGVSKVIRIRYERGQGQVLKELLEVLT
jgi:hypothetical protein